MSNPNPAAATNPSTFTSIENKLQSAAARIRQQREEGHRAQQLAAERLRLVKEEYEVVSAAFGATKENLERIQEQAGGAAAEQERGELLRAVERLKQDVSFQHNELVHKRNKLQEQQERNRGEAERRKTSLAVLLNIVHSRRGHNPDLPPLFMDPTEELAMAYNEPHYNKKPWAYVVSNKAASMEKHAAEDRAALLAIKHQVDQYKERFGDILNEYSNEDGAENRPGSTEFTAPESQHETAASI